MQHLLGAFNRVKKGNFQEHIEEKNNSEFAYLYEGFNEMEDRIQDLIREVYEQKELKQRAELKQLQEQINPHFLYNSLFSIRSKIYREEYESAEELNFHRKWITLTVMPGSRHPVLLPEWRSGWQSCRKRCRNSKFQG